MEWIDSINSIASVLHKNESRQKFAAPFSVAHYGFDEGIPPGTATIYLEPYNDAPDPLWRLVGGRAATGVSHCETPPAR